MPRQTSVRTLAWGLLATLVIAGASKGAAPMPITGLKDLHLETALGAPERPGATIVTGAACREPAVRLQRELVEATGIHLPIVSDTQALERLDALGHLLALGHFGNNRLLEYFYNRWYVIVDAVHPGRGGWVLQTVHNPDAMGVNLVVIGGSDVPGAGQAADRLVAQVQQHGPVLPRLFEIELGLGRQRVLDRGRAVLDPQREWPTGHPLEVMTATGEAGILYLYTGDEAFARKFKQRLIWWLEHPEFYHNSSDDFYRYVIPWDLLEECPVFDDAERLWITGKLLEVLRYYWSPEDVNQPIFMARRDKRTLRHNHRARYANTMFWGGRYFHRYYGLPEAKTWLDDVATYWRPQMTSFAALEGTTSMAHITLNEAVNYALANGVDSFLSPQVFGMIAEKGRLESDGVAYTGSGSTSPKVWWCLAAHLFDEPARIAPLYRTDADMQDVRLPWRVSWEMGRSFWDGRVPVGDAGTAARVAAMPIDALYHEQCTHHGARNVPCEQAFDFLAFQHPDLPGRPYLKVGGHNTGSYSADDANAITFRSHGIEWVGGGWWIATTRNHSTLSVVRDGAGRPLPAFARLDRVEKTPQALISRSTLLDHNGVDWHRNVLDVGGRFFLVVDEMVARQAGDYVLENRWACRGSDGGFDGDDFVTVHSARDQALRLSGTGGLHRYAIPQQYRTFLATPAHAFPRSVADLSARRSMGYATFVVDRWNGPLAAGQAHRFVHLLQLHGRDAAPTYRLAPGEHGGCVVVGEGRAWHAHVDEAGRWAVDDEAAAPAAASSPPLPSVEPTADDLRPRWERRETARIHSAAALRLGPLGEDVRWAVGLGDGRVRIFDDAGADVAEARMPDSVYALRGIDLDGDGRDELVAGSVTGGVRAFGADGAERWSWTPPPWQPPAWWKQSLGTMRMTIVDLRPVDVDGDGKPEILAAGAHFYVLDREGRALFAYTREGAARAWTGITTESSFVMAAGDFDGDGRQEVAGHIGGMGNAGGSTNIGFWRSGQTEPLWFPARPPNRYGGSALKAALAADLDGDGIDTFVIGSEAYLNQIGIYGLAGRRAAHVDVGSGVNVVCAADLQGDGRRLIIAGTEMGQVHALGTDGTRRFVSDVGECVTAMCVVPGGRLWVGTVNGRVRVLDGAGRVVGRGRLPGVLDHMVATADGRVLATTSGGRVARFGG